MILKRISSHTIFRHAYLKASLLCALFLQACSINLTTLNNKPIDVLSIKPIFQHINLYYAGQKHALPNSMLQAYSSVIDTTNYPTKNCYATANIVTTIEKNKKNDNVWYIFSTIIPFSPALPVNEDWTYKLNAKIFCDETLVQNLEFIESAHIQAFWFGAMRSDLVNQASQEMHKKFIERLKFETSNSRQADFNSASDY